MYTVTLEYEPDWAPSEQHSARRHLQRFRSPRLIDASLTMTQPLGASQGSELNLRILNISRCKCFASAYELWEQQPSSSLSQTLLDAARCVICLTSTTSAQTQLLLTSSKVIGLEYQPTRKYAALPRSEHSRFSRRPKMRCLWLRQRHALACRCKGRRRRSCCVRIGRSRRVPMGCLMLRWSSRHGDDGSRRRVKERKIEHRELEEGGCAASLCVLSAAQTLHFASSDTPTLSLFAHHTSSLVMSQHHLRGILATFYRGG